jgi:urease accessory protein
MRRQLQRQKTEQRAGPFMELRVYLSRQASRCSGATAAAIAIAVAALIIADTAAAHTGTGLAGGFMSGFAHPFSGFDHLLAMISVGLWGAFLGRPLIHALPVVFPTVMVAGAAMAMFGIALPPVEIGIALSVLVLGGCIAVSFKAPTWAAALIVATFAIFHGYAHGLELPSAADPIGYSAGFVLATGVLHILGISIGLLNNRPGGIAVTRSLGGAIGLAGVWFLYKVSGI